MCTIKIVFPPEEYPDSYQNDYIEEVLNEFFGSEAVAERLLKLLSENELRIGWINRNPDTGLLCT